MFANEQDANHAYPYDTSTSTSPFNALVWNSTDWAYGRNNIHPSSSTNICTFHVLDALITSFQTTTLFPNLHEIVLAGHSMGAQLVQRHAALTPLPRLFVGILGWEL